MSHQLVQLDELVVKHKCPILYAGDIFHHWRATPELINFALENLPHGFAVPGQHDLPHHSYKERKKSAYWTLVQAGVLKNLAPQDVVEIHKDALAVGYPWGKPIVVPEEIHQWQGMVKIAVIHRYTWTGGHSHPGADREHHVAELDKQLEGFDCAVVGDNHSGFLYGNAKTRHILNCGAFLRRRADERHYKPHVGLIHENGKITIHYLDTKFDKWADVAGDVKQLADLGVDVEGFVELLGRAGDTVADFSDTLARYVDEFKIHPRVVNIIQAAVEAARGKR